MRRPRPQRKEETAATFVQGTRWSYGSEDAARQPDQWAQSGAPEGELLQAGAPRRRTAVPLRFVAGERCARAQLDLDVTSKPAWQLCALPTADATRNTCTGGSGSPVAATNTVWGLVTRGPSCRIDDVGVHARGPHSPPGWPPGTVQPP
ncbi:trypsin-like serine protease [Streptomyces canus]|uniref:trypsin-like serine protease n=1 Tax=Streptomyces canus TaxID=58343 RepID=UPI00339FC0F6